MFWSDGKCLSTARLDGKIALVTGCNSGLGKETVRDFYKRGAKVLLACRDLVKAQEAISDIKSSCNKPEKVGHLRMIKLDLSSITSVRNCVDEVFASEERLDILVNNGGVVGPKEQTEDGFEKTFATNYLGHFLLTLLLLPLLEKSEAARIVSVSSLIHYLAWLDFDDLHFKQRMYFMTTSYGQSKLAITMFTYELAERLKKRGISNITAYSLHPGVVKTDISRSLNSMFYGGRWIWDNLFGAFFKTPASGAQTIVYCSVDEGCAGESGYYYRDCMRKEPSKKSKDPKMCQRLWEESCKMVGFTSSDLPI